MNSIKLNYAEWEALLLENDPDYKGVRSVSMKLKANGIKSFGIGLHIINTGTGMILSNSPFGLNEEILNDPILKTLEEERQKILDDERRTIKLNRNFPIEWGNKGE